MDAGGAGEDFAVALAAGGPVHRCGFLPSGWVEYAGSRGWGQMGG